MLTMACSRHMVSECFPLLANPEYLRAYRIRALKLPVVDLAGKPWRLCVLPRSRAISSLNMPLTTRTISETISAEAQYWPTRHHSPWKPCFRALIDPSSIKYAKAMTHHLASHGAQIWGISLTKDLIVVVHLIEEMKSTPLSCRLYYLTFWETTSGAMCEPLHTDDRGCGKNEWDLLLLTSKSELTGHTLFSC